VYNKILLYLGKGVHKIKKKAEQIACDEALNLLKKFHSNEVSPDIPRMTGEQKFYGV
jgi:hypothetical protein